MFAPTAFAMDGGTDTWVKDWWDNVYELRIEKEQYQKIQEEQQDRCGTKLKWYRDKVREDPTSEYYKYKLETWQDKCPNQ